jgi:alkylated DNA repair dioxygenase AlkB
MRASGGKTMAAISSSFTQAITITFGEVAENHVGNQQIGRQMAGSGITVDELKKAREKIGDKCKTELVDLNEYLPKGVEAEDAAVLIVRGGLDMLLKEIGKDADRMYSEQAGLNPDTKYWDARRSTVLNKQARHNICFSEEEQKANYEKGHGTIVKFADVPCVSHIREKLPEFFGEKAKDLNAEGNYYYDPKKCGIGFHGDGERRIVIAAKLGVSIPLHYQWYQQSERIGKRVELMLNHGDFYVMSAKAVGTDWKKRKIVTLRHAAGAQKYLK